MPGIGPYVITFLGTYYARHDGTVKTWNDDNESCFWSTYEVAISFLWRMKDVISKNCLELPGGPDRKLIGL